MELGRVDILLEVSLLSSHLALPRIGHLQQVYHIFGCLKESPRKGLFSDPTYPNMSDDMFKKFDWQDFYQNVEDDIPIDMPEARGNETGIHCFLYASHAADKVTKRSQTGILIFMNKAPIIFYSKKRIQL